MKRNLLMWDCVMSTRSVNRVVKVPRPCCPISNAISRMPRFVRNNKSFAFCNWRERIFMKN